MSRLQRKLLRDRRHARQTMAPHACLFVVTLEMPVTAVMVTSLSSPCPARLPLSNLEVAERNRAGHSGLFDYISDRNFNEIIKRLLYNLLHYHYHNFHPFP